MWGPQLAALRDGDQSGVTEALDLVAGFDDALVSGFGRLNGDSAAALAALAGAMAPSPLGDRVAEAVDKVGAGAVDEDHLTVLAGARTALLGAVHDALLTRLDTALGRSREAWEVPVAEPVSPPAANLLAGSRSWLTEVAVAGWRGVDHDLVGASGQVLTALWEEPTLRRLAVLLDGFAAELRASCPVATMDQVPVRRWADLWARAMLLSRAGAWPEGQAVTETVSGRLLILGVDIHEHPTAVQIQVHGVLEPSGGAASRLVRTSVSAAKVDTVVGPAVWRLLENHPVLLAALAENRSVDVTDLPLTASGDLLWRDAQARPGDPADPFATARVQLAGARVSPVPPLDRHPVGIAEPVLVEGYTTTVDDAGAEQGVTFQFDGHALPVAVDRLPGCGPLTPKLVAGSSACIGLVRWDGGDWMLQPLAVHVPIRRNQTVTVHNGEWAQGPTDPKVVKAAAKAGDVVAVLRERAGRLLRK